MTRAMVALLALATSACGGSSGNTAEVGSVAFEIPGDWNPTDTHGRGTDTAVFDPANNTRKESITVIRSELGPIATKYTPALLAQLLAGAQTSLGQVKTSPIARISTPGGLDGVRIEVDFVPPGRTQHYHRVHAVLADGSALVHVFYTAASPDVELRTFQKVLDTLHEES